MSLATKQIILDSLEFSKVALFYKDVMGRYTFVNSSAAQMVERTVSQMINSEDHQVFAPRTADIIRLRDQHVATIDTPLAYESHGLLLKGTTPQVYYSVKRAVRTDAGHPAGVLGLTIEISDPRDSHDDTRALINGLARLRTDSLLNICRRGSRPILI